MCIAMLFFRADIARLGIAPLTSMYWYGENERRKAADWRPEIHDSDGLAIWNGQGRAHLAAADRSAQVRPTPSWTTIPKASA